MKAIKYAGKILWKVSIRYDFLSGRGHKTLFILTNKACIRIATKAADKFLFKNESYPNPNITQIEVLGEIEE